MGAATLYNKQKKVLKVNLDRRGQIIGILDVYDIRELPFGIWYRFRNDRNYARWPLSIFADWQKHRRIPKDRERYAETCARFPGIEQMRNQLSLTDQYWFQMGRTDKWEDLNFFTNRYSAAIGRAFFEPWDICPDEIPVNSPDQTTDGGLRKVWIQDPVTLKSSLIKARGEAYRQEPVTEVMASIILEELDIVPFVKYSLIPYGMTFCSKCENFVDQNTEFVSAAQIYRITGRDRENDTEYDHLIRMCKKAGIPDAGESIDNMLMADMLIGNSDRHMGNFGFIRDVETGKITGFAPVFDLSGAFWGLLSGGARQGQRELARSENARIIDLIREKIPREKISSLPEHAKDLLAQYPEVGDGVKRKVGKNFIKNLQLIYGEK